MKSMILMLQMSTINQTFYKAQNVCCYKDSFVGFGTKKLEKNPLKTFYLIFF